MLIELDYPLAYDTSDHAIRSQANKNRKEDEKIRRRLKGRKNNDLVSEEKTRTWKATKKGRRMRRKNDFKIEESATTDKATKK